MSKKKTDTKANKKSTLQEEKALTRKKIEELIEAKGEELEKAAENLAPDFDYEKEAAELEAEESAAIEAAEAEEVDAEEAEETAAIEAAEIEETEKNEAPEQKPLPAAQVSPSKYPKPKREPKTALGRCFLKDKHSKVLGATILLLLAVLVWQGLDYYIPENVVVTYSTLAGAKTETVSTRSRTVGELKTELIQQGYEIKKTDVISLPEDKAIEDGMELSILKAVKQKAKIKGEDTMIWMVSGTVADNLKFNDISYDKNDVVKPALDEVVDEDTLIRFDEVHYVKEKKHEDVKAVSMVILDPNLSSGVQKVQDGNDGDGYFRYKYKYVNGKKVDTSKTLIKWGTEPHNNELRLGTSRTGQSGNYKVVRTFTANCTAYTARPGAGGALGLGVHLGTCAVDPSFVSYRSEMWIEGYGYAFANDCGGAVKGNIVDLFMNSTAECIRWGRRNCTAYVLKPVK